jgi:hypothetical protein
MKQKNDLSNRSNSVFDTKRFLAKLHTNLRNQGFNPIEAVSQAIDQIINEKNSGKPTDLLDIAHADLLAQVVQEFLISESRNGLGQYLTPLPVADLLATLVRSKKRSPIVLDPFCGAGVLLEAVSQTLPSSLLRGIEINPTMASVAASLSRLGQRNLEIIEADAFSLYLNNEIETADIVVANPPFGAQVTGVDSVDGRIPESLRLLGEIPAELFGLEVCVGSLKRNGKLAIVLPTSVLTNKSWSRYRADVFTRFKIDATITLPSETFAPFKGVASSCIILGTKASTNKGPWSIGHWDSHSVGYDGTGRNKGENDLPAIAGRILEDSHPDRTYEVSETGEANFKRDQGTFTGCQLHELADVFVGKNPTPKDYSTHGAKIIKVGDLSGSVLSWRDREKSFVSTDWFNKYPGKHLEVGDILMTAAGHHPRYIGLKVDIIDSLPKVGAIASGEVMVVRVKDKKTNPLGLLMYLKSKPGYQQIQDVVRGSSGHLYAKDLETILIPDFNDDPKIKTAITLFAKAIVAYRKFRDFEDESQALLDFK